MLNQNASTFGISRGSEQGIKQIKKGIERTQILGMSFVQNSSHNTPGSRQAFSLLLAAAQRRKFMVLRK